MRFSSPSLLLVCGFVAACSSSDFSTASSVDSGSDAVSDGVAQDTGGDTSPGSDTNPATDTRPGGDTTPGGETSIDAPAADSGGGPCGPGGGCSPGLRCCGTACINDQNDPLNCGGCGTKCTGETSMCLDGHCVRPTCSTPCVAGEVCCEIFGPGPSGPPICNPGPTCPVGCPACG